MTSQINPNIINGNYPVAGVDNNSQGFRDNFTNTKLNFQYASNEINDLESKVLLKAALTGGVLDNNMDNNLIYAAKIRDFSAVRVDRGSVSGTVTIDYAAGHYQTLTTEGPVSLAFSNFPPAGSYGLMRIQIHITDVAYTMTIPSQVSLGLSGIQGISPGTPGLSNTISFGSVGYYEFAFGTSNNGSTITLFDLNRALTNFTVANISAADLTASGNITGGNVIGGLILSSGNIIAAGDVVGNFINSAGDLSAVGNITGDNVIATTAFVTAGSLQAGNVYATINATAGSTTVAPITVPAGTLLVTSLDGAIEKDNSVFYATPTSGAASPERGIWPAYHVIIAPAGGRTLSQNTLPQTVFDNPANGEIMLAANTTYEIEGLYVITNNNSPSTAHSLSVLFGLGGTLSSISYIADVSTSSGAPSAGATSVTRSYGTVATALQVTPAGTTTSNEIITVYIRGVVRVNAAGAFVPQLQYNTNAPGGASTVTENSWFRLAALGNGSVISVGNWT